ncbi:hypothetical protein JOQ06_003079, partial [Pogonophryne albipinna]
MNDPNDGVFSAGIIPQVFIKRNRWSAARFIYWDPSRGSCLRLIIPSPLEDTLAEKRSSLSAGKVKV